MATASGDRPDCIDQFHEAFLARKCDASHVAFFERDPQRGAVPASKAVEHLQQQDVIFVSGGNTRAALAVWREWGIVEALQEAFARGILLAGMSAGAMCWFEWALTDTYWEPSYRPVPALGFVPGGCRVHYSDAPHQRGRLHTALLSGAVPPTIAISDGAAVLFEAGAVKRVVTWLPGAAAYGLRVIERRVEEIPYRLEALA